MGAEGTLEAMNDPPEDVLVKHSCLSWTLLFSGRGGLNFTSPVLNIKGNTAERQAFLFLTGSFFLPVSYFSPSLLPPTKSTLKFGDKTPNRFA